MFPAFSARPLRLSVVVVAFLLAASLALGVQQRAALAADTNYYVDCSASSNGNGTQASPWNALSSVNGHAAFGAGDAILLKRGMTCAGALTPPGSGASGSPITIDAYGTGALPIISAGSNTSAISLYNQQYWQIQDVETVGASTNGIYVSGDINGVLHNIHITNVVVHDINGTFVNSKDHGLIIVTPNAVNTSFDDVVIDGATAYNSTQWAGILVGGDEFDFAQRSTNVAVRNSTLHDVQGDGIVLFQVNYGTLEHNLSYNTGLHTTQPPGFSTPGNTWVYRCNNCLIQYNEAHDSHSFNSGDALDFDIDAGSSNTIVQYNYGHDSDGPCITFDNGDSGTTNNNDIARYNICANNARDPNNVQGDVYFYTTNNGSVANAQIYNNTFYWNPKGNHPLISDYGTYNKGVSGAIFKNNLVYVQNGTVMNIDSPNMTLDHNLYWVNSSGSATFAYNGTTYTSFASYQSGSGQDANGKFTNPDINLGGAHDAGMPTVAYSLQPGSSAIDAGVNVCVGISGCTMGSRDFFGNTSPQGSTYDIGAYEGSGVWPSAGTNLVSNGGFEYGTLAPWNSCCTTVTVGTTTTNSGSYAAQVVGANGGFWQYLGTLKPNTTYTLEQVAVTLTERGTPGGISPRLAKAAPTGATREKLWCSRNRSMLVAFFNLVMRCAIAP